MTVQTTSSRAGPFTGNNATRIWNTGFRIDQAGDLRVVYTNASSQDQVLDPASYTATGFGDPLGISVTYPPTGPALSPAEKITLLRLVDYDQQTSITNQGGFYPAVIERAFDRIVFQCQQLAEKVARAVTLPVSSTAASLTMPVPAAGRFLRGRDDGTGWDNADLMSSGSLGVPVSISQGGTGATTAALARTNLGSGAGGDAVFAASSIPAARSTLGLGSAALLNAGTAANNVVQLDSAAKLPAVDASQLSGTGRLLNIVTITASGTYTKNPASSYIIVYVIGGGGGAGNAVGGASATGIGGGGSGGGCAIKRIASVSLNVSENVTIGVGGPGAVAGASVTQGGLGGSSAFGAWCSASGGQGGAGSAAGIPNSNTVGGLGTGGDINIRGASAFFSGNGQSNAYHGIAGAAGAGPFGGAGASPPLTGVVPRGGNNADQNSGGGGSGGQTAYNLATSYAGGGNGGSGVIYIFEYA